MRSVLPFSAALLLTLTGGLASAQPGNLNGPLLYAPGANTGAYDLSTGTPISPGLPPRYSNYSTLAPAVPAGANDWRLQHAATWYRNIFGREPNQENYAKWADHFRRGGTTEEVLISMLAGDEFWARSGGDFMDWFMGSALMAGRPVTPQQAAEWRRVYHQMNRDRDAILHRFFDATGVFNQERAVTGAPGPELPSDPPAYGYGSPYGYGAYNRLGTGDASRGGYGNSPYGQPGYARPGYYGPGYGSASTPIYLHVHKSGRKSHDHDD
jgi:hypothetical protein